MKIYRLQRFEVLNWGTFNRSIWQINPDGRNVLMTGDNGAGKSTLLDGLATLLVNPKRMHYNLAGGANQKERSKLSYILGHYKSESAGETTGSAGRSKPVPLRTTGHQSILLAVFSSGDDQVTLAQVFWCNDLVTPNQIFLVAEGDHTIDRLFIPFTEPTVLRKRLKETPGFELFDTFSRYGEVFRRRLGIDSEQAMDLFAKTMAMKDVENLTTFVRGSMLDPTTIDEQIDTLLGQFDALQDSHRRVVEAREQIADLMPIMEKCDQYQQLQADLEQGRTALQALPGWIASREIKVLERRISQLDIDLKTLSDQIATAASDLEVLRESEVAIRIDIERAGGGRIVKLEGEIADLRNELKRRTDLRARYVKLVAELGQPMPDSVEAFHIHQAAIRQQLEDMGRSLDVLTNAQGDLKASQKELDQEERRLSDELDSLRTRTNRIPRDRVLMRDRLCAALDIPTERLPFAGELMCVREGQRDWELAIERALRGFATTLLVPQDIHDRVAAWINANDLGLRQYINRYHERQFGVSGERQDSIVAKVAVKPGPAHDWLHTELVRRFNYRCCETTEDAKRFKPAITKSGYIAYDEDRSEKDDRFPASDRRGYLLGWTNQDLIADLVQDRLQLDLKRSALQAKMKEIRDGIAQHGNNRLALGRLADVTSYSDLDAAATAATISEKQQEIAELEASSDRLASLKRKQTTIRSHIDAAEKAVTDQRTQHTRLEGTLSTSRERMTEAGRLVGEVPDTIRSAEWPRLESLAEEHLPGRLATQSGISETSDKLSRRLGAAITSCENALKPLVPSITRSMSEFNGRWQNLVHELDPSPEAAPGYRGLLQRLTEDDLPTFEERFRTMLRENAFKDMAAFNATLYEQRATVFERLDQINDSLKPVTFRDNPHTYIQLVPTESFDQDVRAFRDQLRQCTQGIAGSSEVATQEDNERKFAQISELLAQLRGRPELTELDLRWRKKVTDVRQWFEFGASERRHDNGQEEEHYSDSNGKSGGQKENLAYTMLAAGLAYQYRIHDPDRRRGFRFVIIDEAFAKASDKITNFGLTLFGRLGLQMLVATPLTKVHAIEPHVASVAFIHIVDRKDSRIRNMTLEEMHRDRSVHQAVKRAQTKE